METITLPTATAAVLIYSGDIIRTECKVHGKDSPHRFQPGDKRPLVCVICEDEAKHVAVSAG